MPNDQLGRRSFLLSSLLNLGFLGLLEAKAMGRTLRHSWKTAIPPLAHSPKLLASLHWPPGIAADFIGLTDNGILCLVDDYGRMALVQCPKNEAAQLGIQVLSELDSINGPVLDFAVSKRQAITLFRQSELDQHSTGEPIYCISFLDIKTPSTPLVSPNFRLDKFTQVDRFAEANCLAINNNLFVVGGTTFNDENLICIYALNKDRTQPPQFHACLSITYPIKALDWQDKCILVLHGDENSYLSAIDVNNSRSPELKWTFTLPGYYNMMARSKDVVLLANGKQNSRETDSLIALGLTGKPHLLPCKSKAKEISILALVARKEHFFVLAEENEHPKLLSYLIEKSLPKLQTDLVLPNLELLANKPPHLVANETSIYISCGWHGVHSAHWQASKTTSTLSEGKRYTVPRLAASSIAAWDNQVVLAGASLQLYNISKPNKPILARSASLDTIAKTICRAGSSILCLDKNGITLRHLDELDKVAASLSINGKQMSFDPVSRKLYLLADNKKDPSLIAIDVYSDKLLIQNSVKLEFESAMIFANSDEICLSGMHDLSFYRSASMVKQRCSRHFDNLAVRDFVFDQNCVYVTAIHQNSQGFLLILDKHSEDLKILGSLDLPHDGIALAISEGYLATIGRTSSGKNLLTQISAQLPTSPKIIASIPILESAASLAIEKNLAIIAGRGLDIITLS